MIVNGTFASELRTRFWPDAVHVLGNDWILDDLRFPFHFLRHLLAKRDLFFQRIEVHSLADVPVADLFRILSLVLTARDGARRP